MDPYPFEKTQALLDDARLMLGYASRMGRLPGRNLLAVIEKVEATKPGDAAYPHAVTELLAAVNQLAQAIRPATLADLDSQWTPFPQHRYDPWARPLIALVATALIFVLGYMTFDYTRARNAADGLTQLEAENVAGRSEHLYDHWNLVKGNLPPASVQQQEQASAYYREMELVQRLQNRIDENTGLAETLSHEPAMIFVVWTRGTAPPVAPAVAVGGSAPKLTVANLDLTASQISATYDNRSDYNQLSPEPVSTAPTGVPDNPTAAYDNALVTFLLDHGLGGLYAAENSNLPALFAKHLRACNDIISIYGLWVLPALYGLFGALVYHLRSMMNPHVATPNLIAARWALAMMAGVSVSWVFNTMSSSHPGGITVFGLAFLFGYSVDVFFAALDRLVAQLSNWAPKSG